MAWSLANPWYAPVPSLWCKMARNVANSGVRGTIKEVASAGFLLGLSPVLLFAADAGTAAQIAILAN